MRPGPRIGSLCSGVGGLDAGLIQHLGGGTVAWHVEYDRWPSVILAHHHPDVPNHGDVKTTDWAQVWEDTVMAAPRNDAQADAMYRRYKEGVSLAAVAREYGVTRQTVYALFKRRGWDLHPRPPGRLFQLYNGQRYTLRNNGYYGATTGTRQTLHRQVWEDTNGPIPPGYDIHHRDRNRANNSLSNLECLPKDEHARLYGTGCNAHVHRCAPDCSEEVVPTDSPAVDWLTAGYP